MQHTTDHLGRPITRTAKYGQGSPYRQHDDPEYIRRPLVRDLDNMMGLPFTPRQQALLRKWRAEAVVLEGEPERNPGGMAMPRVVGAEGMSPQEHQAYVEDAVRRAMAERMGQAPGPAGRPLEGAPPPQMAQAQARMAAEIAAEQRYREQTVGRPDGEFDPESYARPEAAVAAEPGPSRAPQAGAPQPPPKPRPQPEREEPEPKGATVGKAKG